MNEFIKYFNEEFFEDHVIYTDEVGNVLDLVLYKDKKMTDELTRKDVLRQRKQQNELVIQKYGLRKTILIK